MICFLPRGQVNTNYARERGKKRNAPPPIFSLQNTPSCQNSFSAAGHLVLWNVTKGIMADLNSKSLLCVRLDQNQTLGYDLHPFHPHTNHSVRLGVCMCGRSHPGRDHSYQARKSSLNRGNRCDGAVGSMCSDCASLKRDGRRQITPAKLINAPSHHKRNAFFLL